MSAKKVFISYSHDSDEHRDRVLELSERLRADGIETVLDLYLNGWPLQGWPRWMMDQVDAADSVLVVCTETYYRRFRGHEEPGKGRGGDWEGALITQEIYDSRSRILKFVPVFLSAAVEDWIPEPLRSGNYYALTSEVAYQSLYDFLLEQGGVEPQPVGQLKTRPRRKGKALTFAEPPPTEVADEVISPDEFIDDRIRVAATRMNQARAEKSLTMRSLVSTLDRLFERDTFRWEPSIAVCVTKEWDYRLHSALQTLRFMEDYEPFVEAEAPAFLQRYRELTAEISRYALRMAAYLFDPSVGVSGLRKFIGTKEFTPRVKPNRKQFENGVDAETCSKIDPYLTGAIQLMKTLNDEVLGIAESAQAIPDQRPQIGASQTKRRTPVSQPFSAQTTIPADISRIVRYAPENLIGREDELKLLNDAWAKVQSQEAKRPHVLTFVALGGEGKTSLVAKWAAELAHQGWPGCDAVFAWSFYSQGTREQMAASSDLFLKEALMFFGDNPDKEFAASSAGAFEKGQRLARIVGQRRSLLILDGLEPLQYSTSATAFKPGDLKDQGVAKLLKDLATASQGLCIVTTRVEIPDLQLFRGGSVIETHLKRLSRKAGVDLLKRLGVKGSERRNLRVDDDDPESEQVNEFEKLVEEVKGHALTLTLLGGFLKRAFHGDIRQRDRVKFEKADAQMDGGHAFRTMAAYEQWLLRDGGDEGRREVAVLRLMGLFDRPADAGCLATLRSETIPGLTEPLAGLADDDWEFCLSGLEGAKLLTVNRDNSGALISLDSHPHLREYFARQLRTQQPDAWRAAHRRIYEHLVETTKEGDQPTLEDLQPLYQAVAHGCQAGLQNEAFTVLDSRIGGVDEKYPTNQLGAYGSELGAVACFFAQPWSYVAPEFNETREHSWLLSTAAFDLRALGRLTESIEPMRAGLSLDLKLEDWTNAAIDASNVSQLGLTLGDVAGAVRDAEQSVTYADRSGDWRHRMTKRTTHADALHQSGRRAEAVMRFREAEQMQKEMQPDYPLLYSWRGFKYCDLLLAAPEHAAWQMTLEFKTENSKLETSFESCRAVSLRAKQTLKIGESKNWLLTIALDRLTLSRVALCEVVLALGGMPFKTQDSKRKPSIEAAVNSLRRSGNMDELPRGLLTRAWWRFLTGARTGIESAQEDLDEAWKIAERGPMRLFMADIHLYRARLFHGVKPYPWGTDAEGNARGPKDDLAAARKLIEQCGYWRRKEELEDAEEAAKSW